MRTKPRFVTIDTRDFANGQMPVWDADKNKFNPSNDSAALNIKGAWATGTDYIRNDIVEDSGSSYVCILVHTSSATDEPGVGDDWETYWQVWAEKGEDGAPGATGAQGPAGNDGASGADGTDGQGVPTGGTAGQVLAKIDATDYNTEWVDPPEGGGSGSGGGGLSAVVDDTTPVLGGELDADTNKIINLGAPTNDNDAATKKYVDDNAGGGGSVDIRDVWLFA